MDTKDFLAQVFIIDQEIRVKKEQIRYLRDMQTDISYTISAIKVKSSPRYDTAQELSATLIDLMDEYNKDLVKLLKTKKVIKQAINKIKNTNARIVAEERYINLKKWEDIAGDNFMSVKWTYELHKRAIKELEKILSKNKSSL